MRTWLDGRLVEDDEARVSVFDHGLTVGDGVFETLKSVDGRLFALSQHLDRLARSAELMGLPAPDREVVAQACREVAGQEGSAGLMRVRVTYTAGPGPLGSDRGSEATTLVVAASPVPQRPPTERISVAPWPRNERGVMTGVKSTSYAENAVALAWARRQGSGEAVFANTTGMLCEGTGSNIFVIIDGALRTPPLRSGCLAGITRQLVLDWTGAAEEEMPAEVLLDAEEVFLTSSTRDVHPVGAVDGRERPAPGPVTREVVAAWDELSPTHYDQPEG